MPVLLTSYFPQMLLSLDKSFIVLFRPIFFCVLLLLHHLPSFLFFFIKNHETNLPSDKRIKSTTPIRDIRTKCEVSEWDSYLSHFRSPTRQTLWAGIHFCEHDVTIVIILIKFSF